MKGTSACLCPAVSFTCLSPSAEGVCSKYFAPDPGGQTMQGQDTSSFTFISETPEDKLFFQM